MYLKLSILAVFFVGILLCATYVPNVLNTASANFPVAVDITVREGMSHRGITELMEEKGAVRSSWYLYFVLSQMFGNEFVQAGTYRFDTPLTTHEVAQMLIEGSAEPLVSVTFPEGFSVKNMLTYLPESLKNSLLLLANDSEGYLFPDTYFITKDTTFEELLTRMRATFDKKLSLHDEAIKNSTLTKEEIVTLASIVEREAKNGESKKMVAGVLLNRLAINMPLQVDATFDYIIGKTSAELTLDDLAMDSPYNTYKYLGLPPTPISNPGMESILAVLEPTESEYLYYLTANDGTFHYAKTFEEHKVNKERYLR